MAATKDGEYVYSVAPDNKVVDFAWKDGAAQKGKTSYYYVRGEQADGELVVGESDVDYVQLSGRCRA